MFKRTITPKTIFFTVLFGLASAVLFDPLLSNAQIYINPIGPSIGGNSATILNTSSTTQQKLGSLLIGQTGSAPARLCLNGTGDLTGGDDATSVTPGGHCITSWANITNAIGGPFVNLVQTAPTANPSLLSSYAAPQQGYVRVKGSGTITPYTFQTDANNAVGAVSPTAALYAGASLIEDYAGYFSGKFSIEPSENGGVQISRGRLCLNSTFNNACVPGDPNYANCQAAVNNGYYCISDWSQINSANITDQLTLQTLASPTTESGGVSLTQAFNAGAAVMGVPPSSSPANLTKPFCGDGLCSIEINENQSASPNFCQVDCESIPVETSLYVQSAQINGGVQIIINPRPIGSTGTPYMLVVRSNVASFSFEPTDGANYVVGGNSNFAVVSAGPQTSLTPFIVSDQGNGIVPGQTYTYRVYEANAYPRYAKLAAGAGFNYYQFSIAAGAISGGGGTGGSGGSGCVDNCDPPIIRGGH